MEDYEHYEERTGARYIRKGGVVKITSPFVTITKNEQGILFEPNPGLFGSLLPKPGKNSDGSSFHPAKDKNKK